MACTIKAHVRNAQGEIVESKLFNDLLRFTSNNRAITKEYYAVGTDKGFLEEVKDKDEYKVDENGEITLDSLRTLADLDFETDKVVEVLNKDIGEGIYDYEEALRRVESFKEHSPFADKMIPTMIPTGKKGKFYVSVVPISSISSDKKGKKGKGRVEINERKKLHTVVRNVELEKRIITLLKAHKVSVKFLEDGNSRYSAVDKESKLENGLYGLIEVSKNGDVTDELAEEAGHFAVGALGENPLVQRLENVLQDKEAREEALGIEEYNKAYLGENPAREVAGRLVGKALKRKLSGGSVVRVLANRIANLAKRVFYTMMDNEVAWAVAKAEQIANRIAYDFVDGRGDYSVDNAREETLFSGELSTNQQVYKDTVNELGRAAKELEAISNNAFAKNVAGSLGAVLWSGTDMDKNKSALQVERMVGEKLAFDGIVQAVVQLDDYLGNGQEVSELIKSVNTKNPSELYPNMARFARRLRQARSFLRSAEVIIDLINKSLDELYNDGHPLVVVGNNIKSVQYMDEQGMLHTVDMEQLLIHCKGQIDKFKKVLEGKEIQFFARFCEDIYGAKYITSTANKLFSEAFRGKDGRAEEETVKIYDLIMGKDMDDIDIFHRYIGSMSNNPDIIGQIIDKAAKTANKLADDEALQYRDRLAILDKRAKDLGLKMEDLMEKDEETGLPTGNIISLPPNPTEHGNEEEDAIFQAYKDKLDTEDISDIPAIDYGRWEKERSKIMKETWKKFTEEHPDYKEMSGFARGLLWQEFKKSSKELEKWNAANCIEVEITDENGEVLYKKHVPDPIIYKSSQYEELKKKYPRKNGSNDSVIKWLHDYMQIKKELDRKLPPGSTVHHRLPQFRGTFANSLRQSRILEKGPLGGIKNYKNVLGRRWVLDNFVATSEDYDLGAIDNLSYDEELIGENLDFEKSNPSKLPIFGIKKLPKMQDLASDLICSMTSYACMATSYSNLSNIVDAIEVGTEAMFNREIKGKNTIVEKGLLSMGKAWNKKTGRQSPRWWGATDRAYARTLKYVDKQIYGKGNSLINIPFWVSVKKDENGNIVSREVKKIVLDKLWQNLNALAGSLFLKWNIPGGVVNTVTGFNNIFKESAVGELMNMKGWWAAHGYYYKEFLPSLLTESGKLKKNTKLSLFLERMNSSGNNKTKLREWKTTRSRLNNIFRDLGYYPYALGDHYMQAMSYLSVAYNTMLYDTDGKEESNLWDAFHRKDNTDEFNRNPSGKVLEFKKLCPVNADELTAEAIDKQGVYLKEPGRGKEYFEKWLLDQDPMFADEGYRASNPRLYNAYRKQFDDLSQEDLLKYVSKKYKMYKSILTKTEAYIDASSSPFVSVPVYTDEEKELLERNGIHGLGNYPDILQVARNNIYNLIWSRRDESAYMDKCREINNRLHGIYNRQDKTAFHQNVFGNLFLAMKGWLLGYIEGMFSPTHYSVSLGRNVEGYLRTGAKIPIQYFAKIAGGHLYDPNNKGFWGNFKTDAHLATDLICIMFNPWTKSSKNKLLNEGFSEHQVYNARRFQIHLALISTLAILGMLLAKGEGDDDDDDDYWGGIFYYFAMRALKEQEVFLSPVETRKEASTMFNLFPAGGSAVWDLGLLTYQLWGYLFGDEKDSDFFYQKDGKGDRYSEGDSKFGYHLIKISPLKSVWFFQGHGYEAYDNYQFGKNLKNR